MKNKIKAVYAGRVRNGKNHLQRFIVKGKERYHKGVHGVHIGYTYWCASKTMPRYPERTDDEWVNNPKWEAEDLLVSEQLKKRRAELKFLKTKKSAQQQAVDAIRVLCEGFNFWETHAVVKGLVDQIMHRKLKRKR